MPADSRVAGYASTISVLISIGALAVAAKSCDISRSVPTKIAKYQTASAAFSRYSEAVQDYDNFLRRPHLKRVFGGDPAKVIPTAAASDFNQFYDKAQPALDAYDAFTSKVNSVREPWLQTAANNKLMDAGTAGRVAVLCYLEMQGWSEGKMSLEQLRTADLADCKDEDDFRVNFENSANLAIAEMQEEVRAQLPE